MNEQLKPTSADEINAKAKNTEMVLVPSKDVYEIKKVVARHYVVETNIPIDSKNDIERTQEEKDELIQSIYSQMTSEEKQKAADVNNRLIIDACVSPKVSLKEEAGSVCIDNISDTDYYFLLNAIREYMRENVDVKNS